MTITRNDVARKAGVSSATVSYVINNGPRPVSTDARSRVLNAIRELGYKPSAVARSLRLQKTSTLGLIVPDTHNPFFSEIARGVERIAFENGYTVVLCHSSYDSGLEMQYVDMLQGQRAAGIIWIPATDRDEPVQKLRSYDIPTVIIDRIFPGQVSPAVVANNVQGGYLATRHLIQLGHRRIGFISRPLILSHSQGRLQGYRAALEESGIPFDPQLVVRGGFELENGRQAALLLMERTPPVTAIFAYNDMMAIGALRAACEHGLRIPQDISIVGFDDIAQAAFTCPALTTIYMPKFEIGQSGARLLFSLIRKETIPGDSLITLDVSLVIRESSGPAPLKVSAS